MVKVTTETQKIMYPYSDVSQIYSESVSRETIKSKGKKGGEIYNTPAAFDIETTSFMNNGEETGVMYIWMFGIGDSVFYGRTWEQFITFINSVVKFFGLSVKRRLIVYVHNLAFEFQFIKHLLEWEQVFAIENRKPVKAISKCGIEFRCSYILSGRSLKDLADNIPNNSVKKLTGDLDYRLYRHSNTELTPKELDYCYNDIDILLKYIQYKIDTDGNVAKILLTKTSYVRQYCRDKCFENIRFKQYKSLMSKLTISENEYKSCKRAFAGGFTHCSHDKVNKIIKNVESYDITSSYPAVMCSEKYPMGLFKHLDEIDIKTFNNYRRVYCCIFDVSYNDIRPKDEMDFEHPISNSKCWNISNDALIDNGRVVSASYLSTTVTDIDFDIYEKFYDYDNFVISNIWVYNASYLPKPLIESVLHFYNGKTVLKGIEGKESEYALLKEYANSCYGMIVTDPVRDEIVFDEDWCGVITADLTESLEIYNNSFNRFLYYPWGVFITAYARNNLFKYIMECGYDYIYSDTDSVKSRNIGKHKRFIKEYNKDIQNKIKKCLEYHSLNVELANPKNKKGENKPLGVWDSEGQFEYFKSLGAKRYVYIKDGELHTTVAGCEKKAMIMNLLNRPFNEVNNIEAINKDVDYKVLDRFKDGLSISTENANKLLLVYNDNESRGVITDYKGESYEFHEYSSAYLGQTTFTMSMSREYRDYIASQDDKELDTIIEENMDIKALGRE